jgi:C1A family cysteine protease
MNIKKFRILILAAILFIVLISHNVYADEQELELINDKQHTGEYERMVTNVSEGMIGEYSYNQVPSIIDDLMDIRAAYSLQSIGATYSDTYYNIADDQTVKIRNQKDTSVCWIIPAITSMEINMQLSSQSGSNQEFSVRHCNYATARDSFVDGINEYGYNRKAEDGGKPIFAYRYLTNGLGAVSEEDMPFEANSNNISLADLDKPISQIATGFEILPTINKRFDSSGNVKYYDSSNKELSTTEVKALRNIVKNHIINYGGISALTYSDSSRPNFYNNSSDIKKATAYYCDDPTIEANHGVTIIGWDDSYSKNNFNNLHRPKNDGAYIVMDSYGATSHNNGMYYISYDDALVEYNMIGVTGTSDKDYDNLYQNDFFGATMTIGNKNYDTGYIGSVFERDNTKNETLEYVGISSTNYARYEIYVNPKGTSMNSRFLVKVGETAELMPGYTRVAINPTKLEGAHYAIVVKQMAEEGEGFYFPIEVSIDDTQYNVITGTEEGSYISYDGRTWKDIKDTVIMGVELSDADTCLKGYTKIKTDDDTTSDIDVEDTTPDTTDTTNTTDTTQDPQDTTTPEDTTVDDYVFSLKTTKYAIKDGYLYKIDPNTSIEGMMQNITHNAKTISIVDKNNQSITDSKVTVTTGMTIIFNGEITYKLVVRGDINGDGKVTLTDISRLVFHYNEYEEYQLTDAPLKAADMNYDGKITLTDLSQLVFYYSSI